MSEVKRQLLWDLVRSTYTFLNDFEVSIGVPNLDPLEIELSIVLPVSFDMTELQSMLGNKYSQRLETNLWKDKNDFIIVSGIITESEMDLAINYLQNL